MIWDVLWYLGLFVAGVAIVALLVLIALFVNVFFNVLNDRTGQSIPEHETWCARCRHWRRLQMGYRGECHVAEPTVRITSQQDTCPQFARSQWDEYERVMH